MAFAYWWEAYRNWNSSGVGASNDVNVRLTSSEARSYSSLGPALDCIVSYDVPSRRPSTFPIVSCPVSEPSLLVDDAVLPSPLRQSATSYLLRSTGLSIIDDLARFEPPIT